MSYESVGEAISLAANQLVLRDLGRTAEQVQPTSQSAVCMVIPSASTHVTQPMPGEIWSPARDRRNAVACLILGAYQVRRWTAWPVVAISCTGKRGLKRMTWKSPALWRGTTVARDARCHSGQRSGSSLCRLVQRYGELNLPPQPVFDLLLHFATSEDGALHAEKYYRTVTEEFVATRPAFRWRQLVALARVTASECGRPAPGYAESRELLKV